MQHAIDNGATRLWCNASTPALSLYERAGFVATSDEFETPASGPTTGWSCSTLGRWIGFRPVAGDDPS